MSALRMRCERSQLLLVDLQERLVPAIDSYEALAGSAERLAKYAVRLGVPVTISEQYPKGLGPTLGAIRVAAGTEAVTLAKVEFSCGANAGLAARLASLKSEGRTQVVVAGVEAHVCVLQTVLDLVAAGFDVFVAADAVGSRRAESKALALSRMQGAGAVIADSEMVAFEWLECAGTPEFRDVQALLK
ncbi:MAG: isochorismatase family protein [Hyphomicrobiaceae bacterium]